MAMKMHRVTIKVTVDLEAQDMSHATDIALEEVQDAVDGLSVITRVVEVTPSN